VSEVVEVSLEVRSGTARFTVALRAESIERATSIVAMRYPGVDCRVRSPMDPGGFFVNDAAARARIASLERPDVTAA
jgi:hypothetical protein